MAYDDFINKRKKILNKKDWELIDNWPLYVGKYNLARSINNIELIKQSIEIPGDIIEFGCWKGANLLLIAKTIEIFSPMTMKNIWGFDLFKGLDFFDLKDGESKKLKGKYKGDEKRLREIIKLFELNDRVNLIKGNILKTLPDFLDDNPSLNVSLIYIDTDLYKSTKLILNSFHDRLVKGGMFVLDEWNTKLYPGESVATKEFLDNCSKDYDLISVKHSLQPSLLLKKIR